MSTHGKKNWKKFKEEHELPEEELEMSEAEVPEEASEQRLLTHPSYLALSELLTQTEQKALRIQAELDNMSRRTEREVENAHKYGIEKLISAALPGIDSIDAALELARKEGNVAMCEGLELTQKLFIDAFKKFGAEAIDPQGLPFDPRYHEAIAMQPAPDMAPNTVMMVVQKGYSLHDRVVRPARVIVSQAKT